MSQPSGTLGVPAPAASSNIRLPPPRFHPGTESSMRSAFQSDPLLKLIPSKRPPPTESALPANLPPLPPLPSPVIVRKYSVSDAPVTDNWDDEFRIWADQEVAILAREDKALAASEQDVLFGVVPSEAMETVRKLLRNKSDTLNFRRIKEMVARMLNNHRVRLNPRVDTVPFDPLPEAERAVTTDPPMPHDASQQTHDVKPEIITLDSDDEDEERDRRGRNAVSAPPAAAAAPPVSRSTPPQIPIPRGPPARMFHVQGMTAPFPPYFTEIYLSTRKSINDPEASLRAIKQVFPEWTTSMGDNADTFIREFERAAVDEEKRGGCTEEEQSRRVMCTKWYIALEPGECRRLRQSHGSAARSPPAPRAASPVASRQESSSRTVVPGASTHRAKRICKKCAADSHSCDGQDPCAECVRLGIFHLCVYPDPPRLLASDSAVTAVTQAISTSQSRHSSNAVAVSIPDHNASIHSSRAAEQPPFSPPPNHNSQLPSRARTPPGVASRSAPSPPAQNRSSERSRTTSLPQPTRQTISLDQARAVASAATTRALQDSSRRESGSASARPQLSPMDQATLNAARQSRTRQMSGSTLASPADRRNPAFPSPPIAPPLQRSRSSQTVAKYQTPAWQALLQDLRPHLDVLADCLKRYPVQ